MLLCEKRFYDAQVIQHKTPKETPGAIVINPATEIQVKRPRGRPRKYPKDMPRYMRWPHRRGNNIPRCMARCCYRFLRLSQKAVCSDACWDSLFNQTMHILRMLDVTREDMMDYFDKIERVDRKKKATDERRYAIGR